MRAAFLPPNVKRRSPLPEALQVRAALALAGQSVAGFAKVAGLDCEILSNFLAGGTKLPWPALAAIRASIPPAIEMVLSRDELTGPPRERLPLKYGTMLCGARFGAPIHPDDAPPWLPLLRAGSALLGIAEAAELSEATMLTGPSFDSFRVGLIKRGVLFVAGGGAGPGVVVRWPRRLCPVSSAERRCES